MATNSPAPGRSSTTKLTSLMAVVRPYCLVTLRNSTTGGTGAGASGFVRSATETYGWSANDVPGSASRAASSPADTSARTTDAPAAAAGSPADTSDRATDPPAAAAGFPTDTSDRTTDPPAAAAGFPADTSDRATDPPASAAGSSAGGSGSETRRMGASGTLRTASKSSESSGEKSGADAAAGTRASRIGGRSLRAAAAHPRDQLADHSCTSR